MTDTSIDTGSDVSEPPRAKWLCIAWCFSIVAGSWASVHYASKPAEVNDAATVWPLQSAITRRADGQTLVLFIHPKCPCSRATLAELCVLLSRGRKLPAVNVVFVRPPGMPDGWEKSDLWKIAQGIPDATVLADAQSQEADLFRATTSGEAFLYDHDGRLMFQGGLTWARGHEGDSEGLASLASLLDGGDGRFHRAPVYGCSLAN